MKFGIAVVIVGLMVFAISRVEGREIGFSEDFALARDRAEILSQLIPGTADYYYYHCLHAQHTGDFDQVRKMLELWIKREGYTPRVKEILNRQALLDYETDPKKSLAHIRRELDLRFDHEKESTTLKQALPSSLDQNLISIPHLSERAFAKKKNLDGFTRAGLDIVDPARLDLGRLRNFLKRLPRPDVPNLPEFVTRELRDKHSGGFGAFPIHGMLFKSQMDECLALMPELLDNTQFVNTYMLKLAPGDDTDIRSDSEEKRAFLERLLAFTRKLSPAFNSLKAHVLYMTLDFKRSEGDYDQALFLEYARIPRNTGQVNPDYLKGYRREMADLGANFKKFTRFPPITADDDLVRDFLSHFFVEARHYKTFEKYFRDGYLNEIFAETKIANGLGDMEKWYSMLGPARYKALKERVDLDFSPANKTRFGADEPVTLELYIKNIDTMLVKIFELNAFNYYRENMREIDTAIPLDGLMATREKAVSYDKPPQIRHRAVFEFPKLNRPGIYAVEFIGNGKSSRALIRKGGLYFLERPGPAGHEFAIFDETGAKRAAASLWLAGREFKPDEDGTVIVPYTEKPGRQKIILKDGDFCSLAEFGHLPEHYEFYAGFYLDRESLLAGFDAKVIVRPCLRLNGRPVSLSLLENIRLAIRSENIEGLATTKEIADFELFEDRESEYVFGVQENLAKIRFTLKASVKNAGRNEDVYLNDSSDFKVGGHRGDFGKHRCDECGYIHTGNSGPERCPVCGSSAFADLGGGTPNTTHDLFMSRIGGQYVLSLLGKNGEAKSGMPIAIELRHRHFRQPVRVSLGTDKDGRCHLGGVEGIVSIRAEAPGGVSKIFRPDKYRHTWPGTIHGRAGEILRVPYAGAVNGNSRLHYALFETRNGSHFADHTNTMHFRNGFLEASALPAGDYLLFLKKHEVKIDIRLTDGRAEDGAIISAGRLLETVNELPMQISDVSTNGKALAIRLANATEFSRVHVVATRFAPGFDPFSELGLSIAPQPGETQLAKSESIYVAGRNIGDEYRYVLDRKYAKKFPGNMLDRPELLLNPWSVRKTEALDETLEGGADYRAATPEPTMASEKQKSYYGKASGAAEEIPPSPDFLAGPSVVLTNLKPDSQGVVSIDLKLFKSRRHIHILAADHYNTVYRQTSLAEDQMETRDLRLAQSLDIKARFTEQKRIAAVRPGETLTLSGANGAEYEAYDSIGKVFRLMATLGSNSTLEEFRFIIEWPKMTVTEKQEQYSKYACHELNFFLYHKDRAFFDSAIAPYIANKKNKTFMDRWLIGDNLNSYAGPQAFSQLNIVEKILLSKRGPDDKKRMERYAKELFDMIPPDIDTHNRLFDTALGGRALDTGTGAIDTGVRGVWESGPDSFARSIGAGAAAPEEEIMMDLAEDDLDEWGKPDKKEAKPARPMKMNRGGRFMARLEERKRARQFYKKPDKTEEWAENHYYKLPIADQNAELVIMNAFWLDYALADIGAPFHSPNFVYATRNFTEIMLGLSVLDLPFEPGKHLAEPKGDSLVIKPASPMIVFYKQIEPAGETEQAAPVSVTRNYFRSDDRYRYEGNERFEKYVEKFHTRLPYGCQAVVGNPTSSPKKVRLLLQIPEGAIPINMGFYTKGIPATLGPYQTRTFEYHFYFPKPGTFFHHPAQAAVDGKFAAAARPAELTVTPDPETTDTGSWDFVSQNAADPALLEYLRKNNLNRLDLDKIVFRMKDAKFFRETVALLKQRHTYHHTLWSYGIYHGDPETVSDFLENSEFAKHCGMHIRTKLLDIDPVERKTYQHLEYKPLINARTHRLGKKRQILNDRLHEQYERFAQKLAYRPSLNDADLMDAVYYLLLQDRVEEAAGFFSRIDPNKILSRMQYDYCNVYLDFYSGNLANARQVIAKYTQYPVPKWRNMFRRAESQLNELSGKGPEIVDKKSREQIQEELAATEPAFDFEIKAGRITVSFRNLDACVVNYYPMDIELLFSKNPFMRGETGQFAYIRPNTSANVTLPPTRSTHSFDLPKQFHNANLIVEIVAGGLAKTKAHYANSLDIQIIETYGMLTVAHNTTKKPLPGTYVKVYAKMKNGNIGFYKDGYTDLRGKFDYASLNSDDLDQVGKFAVLVLNDEYGAVVRQVSPPKR